MKQYFNIANLIVLSLIAVITLRGALVRYDQSLRQGEPKDFITGVCTENPIRGFHAYPKIDGLTDYYYYNQTHHERFLFRISQEALLEYISNVPRSVIASLLDGFCSHIQLNQRNPSKLLADLNAISILRFEGDTSQKAINRLKNRILARPKVWLQYLFEVTYMTLAIGFCFFRKKDGRYTFSPLRIASFPLIFLLPHYFGYCQNLYSTVAPGGLFYQIPAMILGLPILLLQINLLVPLNNAIYGVLPQFLNRLEMDGGEWLSSSGGGSLPIAELFFWTVIIMLFTYGWKRLRNQ